MYPLHFTSYLLISLKFFSVHHGYMKGPAYHHENQTLISFPNQYIVRSHKQAFELEFLEQELVEVYTFFFTIFNPPP